MGLSIGYSVLIVGSLAALAAALVLGVFRARRSAAGTLTVVLLAWLATVFILAARGAFATSGLPVPIFLGVALPIVLGGLAITRIASVRETALALPQPWLVSLHVVRLVGFLFLWLWAQGSLPGSFALSAGIGDVTVAIAAPFIAWRLARHRPGATGWLWAWNVFGILDFVFAVTLGALSASGPQRVFFAGPPADALGQLPLSLVPTFGVPLMALTHLVSILKLRHRASQDASPARIREPALR
jgi:hypothetical protein